MYYLFCRVCFIKYELIPSPHAFASGDDKQHFTPGMMGPFLGVALVPQAEVRNIIIPIFHDMMNWEQRKNGNFKQVGYSGEQDARYGLKKWN